MLEGTIITPVIRDAAEGDIAEIADIKVRNWSDTYGPLIPPAVLARFLDPVKSASEMRSALATPGVVLLVGEAEKGGVAGFSLTYLTRAPEPWLESLHVLQDVRGRGLGTSLLRATAARVLAAGHRSMALGVIVGNDQAARFYERLGAVNAGVEPVDFAEGVAHTLYRWPDEAAMRRLAHIY